MVVEKMLDFEVFVFYLVFIMESEGVVYPEMWNPHTRSHPPIDESRASPLPKKIVHTLI